MFNLETELSLVSGPITRTQLALYAGGSGDHNPIHVDPDAARAAGLPDVIAHGMFSAAILGRMLTDAVGTAAIRNIKIRFGSMTNVGDTVECSGAVEKVEDNVATLSLTATAGGRVTLSGSAQIDIAEASPV